ncbi:hypothetical protein BRADI_4g22173v3 [Brachypodium distachyon]|uniref:Uncharacterized protein n=1 Tax=Brachypodium distachyon TaxID=15368 RepID=A0A2K2CPD8_BRADI|nr:hypothetical protein BRADI_4g22173v3 [Brachypodium distachyon]
MMHIQGWSLWHPSEGEEKKATCHYCSSVINQCIYNEMLQLVTYKTRVATNKEESGRSIVLPWVFLGDRPDPPLSSEAAAAPSAHSAFLALHASCCCRLPPIPRRLPRRPPRNATPLLSTQSVLPPSSQHDATARHPACNTDLAALVAARRRRSPPSHDEEASCRTPATSISESFFSFLATLAR